MLAQTLGILQRVSTLVEDNRPWFDTLSEWYQRTKMTRRAIEDRLRSRHIPGRLDFLVNGQLLPGISEVTDARARRVTWLLPSNRLQRGGNELVVRLDKNAPVALVLAAASFEQDYHLPWQTLSLATPEPVPTPNLGLASWKTCFHTGKHWSVDPGGQLQFQLGLGHASAVNFTLHLGAGQASIWLALLHDLGEALREKVREAVKEKLWQLVEETGQAWLNGDPRALEFQQDLQMVSGYLRLDQLHLEPALQGPPDGTLADVIARAGWPPPPPAAAFLGSPPAAAPVPVIEPVLVSPGRRPPRAELVQAAPATYPEAQPALRRQLPSPPARSGGCGLKTLLALVVLGGGGYFLWSNGTLDNWLRQASSAISELTASPNKKKEAALDKAVDDVLRAKKIDEGEVQVTLHWANKNDLDLHVIPPAGKEQEIFYGRLKSACGGELNVDMNKNYENATTDAVENVSWKKGTAPRGQYQVYVVHFANHRKADCQDPTPFTVRVSIRGQKKYFHKEISYTNSKDLLPIYEFQVD